MKGKFNIDMEQGRKDRELWNELSKNQERFPWTEEQLKIFQNADEILAKNKKECEKFKGRDGI